MLGWRLTEGGPSRAATCPRGRHAPTGGIEPKKLAIAYGIEWHVSVRYAGSLSGQRNDEREAISFRFRASET